MCLARVFQSVLLEFKEEIEALKIGRKINMINILTLNLTKRSWSSLTQNSTFRSEIVHLTQNSP